MCYKPLWHAGYGGLLCAVQDGECVLAQFEVGKRICLYLARVSPAQAIDYLAYEAAQLLHQDDDSAAGLPPAKPSGNAPKVLPTCVSAGVLP